MYIELQQIQKMCDRITVAKPNGLVYTKHCFQPTAGYQCELCCFCLYTYTFVIYMVAEVCFLSFFFNLRETKLVEGFRVVCG
jgi:hypothetical protein